MTSARAKPSEWLIYRDRHRNLGALAELEQHIETAPDVDQAWVSALGGKLEALLPALRAHHAAEEEGELYTAVPRQHPEFSRALFRLVAEHDEITQELETLLRAAAVSEPSPEVCDRLALHARRLVTRIRRHECEEEEIQVKAVCKELDAPS